MNRLQYISQINPFWAVHISNFIEEYPEFKQYEYLIPIHPVEPIPYTNVNTLFQAIMHYICAMGVRYSYAIKQWEIMYPLINLDDWEKIRENMLLLQTNPQIQNKKKSIYHKVCEVMNEHTLNHENIHISNIEVLRKHVSGIGVGCVAWCKKYFSFDDDCVEYTDICFVKGFEKVYHTKNMSQRKQKAKEWKDKGFGRISNLMVLQISEYA